MMDALSGVDESIYIGSYLGYTKTELIENNPKS